MKIISDLLIGSIGGASLFGLIEAVLWFVPKLRKSIWNNPRLIFGYHIHHSTYGLIAVIWGIYNLVIGSTAAYMWIGFGLGAILIHTLTGGFVFIEKIQKR